MGPDPVLTTEYEKELFDWITDLARCGFLLKKQELLHSVQKIVKNEKLKTPFKNDRPGEKWYAGFLRRHPKLALKNGECLEKYRANVTEEYIRSWFRDLESFLAESDALDILDDPSRILNADETGFSLCTKSGKVLGLRGENLHIVKQGSEKENLTVLVTFTADGILCLPVVVFPYVKPPRAIVESMPSHWFLGKSETGWMRSDVFFEFVANGLNNWLNEQDIKRTVLFVVDGHKSHMSLELSQFCSDNGIILYALPPNTTHLLQPADVAIFRPLKVYWSDKVREWQTENVNKVVTKVDFCPIFEKVLQNPKLSGYFSNGFKSCGLYPFDPDKVNYSKCVQNQLEKRNVARVEEEEISEMDVKCIEKVILKLKQSLQEVGIDTDFLLASVKSLRQDKNEEIFPEEEIHNMEIVFDNELPIENTRNENFNPPKLVVLQDIRINAVSGDTEKAYDDAFNEETANPNNSNINEVIREEDLDRPLNTLELPECSRTDEIEAGSTWADKIQGDPGTLEGTEKEDGCEKSDRILLDIKLKAGSGTAFTKHLSFPKPLAKTSKRKRERLPSAISSEVWRTHYLEKQKQKENKNTKKRNKSTNKEVLTTIDTNITDNTKKKQHCAVCDEDLESDTETESEKNVGCDTCPRWFHLACTKFSRLSYDDVADADYICDFCEK